VTGSRLPRANVGAAVANVLRCEMILAGFAAADGAAMKIAAVNRR